MRIIESFFKRNKETLRFLIILSTIIFLFFGVNEYFDNKIESKITDKDYIKNLSYSLRPFLIFDGEGHILYDHGAEKKLNSITMDPELTMKNFHNINDFKIVIEPKNYLSVQPLLENLSVHDFQISPNRYKNKSWIYTVKVLMIHVPLEEPIKFKLELIE